MPGIMGYVDFGKVDKKEYLDNMLLKITYDPKYRIEKYVEPPLWIGRSDLTTLNPDPQPASNRDKTLIVFFQGNLVNKKEIQQFLGDSQSAKNCSNAQLILRLVEKLDTQFVHKVKGNFTSFVWNRDKKRLIIANDRFGRYPVYYSMDGQDKLVFGSELKALFSHPSVKKEINNQAIVDFIQSVELWGNETFFQNVHLLPYASVLQFEKGCLKTNRYWECKFSENYSKNSVESYAKKLNRLIKEAVKKALEGNHEKIGILLSGGMDSRNIVANIPKRGWDIHTFTFGKRGGSNVKFAQKVSKKLGFKHHSYLRSSKCIPKYGQMAIYILDGRVSIYTGHNLLWSLILNKQKIDLVLEGTSGNYIFGSSLQTIRNFLTKTCETYSKDQLFTLLLKKIFYLAFDDEELKKLLSADYFAKVESLARKSFEECFNRAFELHKSPQNVVGHIKFIQELGRWGVAARDSFRWKIETIDPFVDYDLIDFMLTIPPELRIWRRLYREAFRRLHPELARIPMRFDEIPMEYCLASNRLIKILTMTFGLATNAIQRLFKYITNDRPLPRFIRFPWDPVDKGEYLREQRDFVEKILLDDRTLSRGLLNPSYVKKLVSLHMSKRKNYIRKLGVLISLELWFRAFMD